MLTLNACAVKHMTPARVAIALSSTWAMLGADVGQESILQDALQVLHWLSGSHA